MDIFDVYCQPNSFIQKEESNRSVFLLVYIMMWRSTFETMILFRPMAVSENKAAAAAVIHDSSFIERLPDILIVLYIFGRVACSVSCSCSGWYGRWWWKEYFHFLRFKICSSGHFARRLDSSSCPQDTGLPSLTSTVPREKNIILLDVQSYWHQEVMRRHILLLELVLWEELQMFLFLSAILRYTSMSLWNTNGRLSITF